DRAFVISVAEEVRLWADVTGSVDEIERRLEGTPGPLFGEPCPKRGSEAAGLRAISVCGPSPLWGALSAVADLRLRGIKGSKAVLLLTDGYDTGSRTWRQAAAQAARAQALVYAIEYPGESGRRYAPDLYQLVQETGGATFQPPKGEYGE